MPDPADGLFRHVRLHLTRELAEIAREKEEMESARLRLEACIRDLDKKIASLSDETDKQRRGLFGESVISGAQLLAVESARIRMTRVLRLKEARRIQARIELAQIQSRLSLLQERLNAKRLHVDVAGEHCSRAREAQRNHMEQVRSDELQEDLAGTASNALRPSGKTFR